MEGKRNENLRQHQGDPWLCHRIKEIENILLFYVNAQVIHGYVTI